jgi:hypothetical protein
MSVIIKGFGLNSRVLTKGFGLGLLREIIIKVVYIMSRITEILTLKSR